MLYYEGTAPKVGADFFRRGVAQPGRAPGSGPGGRRFESSRPDHIPSYLSLHINLLFPCATAVP